jgi:hypothetical protein
MSGIGAIVETAVHMDDLEDDEVFHELLPVAPMLRDRDPAAGARLSDGARGVTRRPQLGTDRWTSDRPDIPLWYEDIGE